MSQDKSPKIRDQIDELQEQLRQSVAKRKHDIYQSYRDVRKTRKLELFEQNRYKTVKQKPFLSQQKVRGDILEKTKDIYLCKEPLIDDFLKAHIMEPQRNLEKGLREMVTGKFEKLDGSCFGDIPEHKLSVKEKSFRAYWDEHNQNQAKLRYKSLIESQTGIEKRINQSNRLRELKIFIPNSYAPGYFDNHPSQILALTSLHQHDKTQIWSPNSFYGEIFDKSFSRQIKELTQ